MKKSPLIVINMLNSSFTTGAFLILNDHIGEGSYTVIYFKDEKPLIVDELNKDISFLYGEPEIADVFTPALKMHLKWEQYIPLIDDNLDILKIPIEKASKDIEIRDLRYWQVSNQILNEVKVVLAYSMPLIDEKGNAFGILGMAVDEEYFHLMMSHSELAENASLGHILGTFDSDTRDLIPVLVYGDSQYNIAPLGIPLELSIVNEELNLYEIENTDTDFPVLSGIYPLEIYEDNTSNDEHWILIGLAYKDQLNESLTDFITTLYVIFWCIAIGGVFLHFWWVENLQNLLLHWQRRWRPAILKHFFL